MRNSTAIAIIILFAVPIVFAQASAPTIFESSTLKRIKFAPGKTRKLEPSANGIGEPLRKFEAGKSPVANSKVDGDYAFAFQNQSDKNEIAPSTAKILSTYTSLDPDVCETIETDQEGGGSYMGMCPGFGNYAIRLSEGDLRQTIDIVNIADNSSSELDLWYTISNAFSALGKTVEGRYTEIDGSQVPFALIVRYNTNEDY